MSLKIRYRAPSGPGSIDLAGDATVSQLFDAVKQATGTANIAIKYGWPPRALEVDQANLSIASLNLHRESLTVVPLDTTAPAEAPPAAAQQSTPAASIPTAGSSFEQKDVKDGPVTVKMPQTDTFLGKISLLFLSLPLWMFTETRLPGDSI